MSNSFFNIFEESIDFAGRTLTLESGHIARQADGAVVAKYGGTVVLCTVVGEKKAGPNADFFPLTVNYQEKSFATGRIPSGFFKREGKPSEAETLISRLIDRPIRPLFPDHFFNEVQVICTVLSHDRENNPDIVALIGASAALAISGIPFLHTVCAARVGYIGGRFVLNPLVSQMSDSKLDLVVAGTKDGVLMVESEAQQLSEDIMLGAIKFGHESFAPVLQAIASLKEKAGKAPWVVTSGGQDAEKAKEAVLGALGTQLRDIFEIKEKKARREAVSQCKEALVEKLCKCDCNSGSDCCGGHSDKCSISPPLIEQAFDTVEYELLRSCALHEGKRIDGRRMDEIRPISCEVGILPRVHGSALFTRGETQALVVATLGSGEDEQIVDHLTGDFRESFLLHYNFPPYSVGEVGRMGSPGRREIGHGRLAWRATHPLVPTKTDFPYTIRLVSEVTESNGSSSMATVCGSSLALMDAGIPLSDHIAGIAMGLIKEGDDFVVLSDIQGDEDHLGDMDFKVAGTGSGITALQMDIKITSITFEIMKKALEQALIGRKHIISKMREAIGQSRDNLSSFAPQIMTVTIDKDKIRDLIGPGGKVIREICEKTGAKIDISDDGVVSVFGPDKDSLAQAMSMVDDIAGEPEIGQVYTGTVVKIMEFGAFVNFFGRRDGLVHISEISNERVDSVEDVLNVGDSVKVILLDIDERTKRARLSIKAVGGEKPVKRSSGGDGDRSRGGDRKPRDGDRPRGDGGPRGNSGRPRGDGGPRGDGPRGRSRPSSPFNHDRNKK
ncbi:MAG: polyribonucleotide nucleotidyltransferase [Holosporales bacterium]|jgi:polyribonucleotide nucleotidyltransferase|nr:polyribonucleotide nucleotidyltransferase [Holosporales bacterium]